MTITVPELPADNVMILDYKSYDIHSGAPVLLRVYADREHACKDAVLLEVLERVYAVTGGTFVFTATPVVRGNPNAN